MMMAPKGRAEQLVPRIALYRRERVFADRRNVSWWAIKTPGVILDEMRVAREEVESLGRDIYATFQEPFSQQLAAAVARFEREYGRKPGVGRLAEDDDYETVHSWMVPRPTPTDLRHVSYQGQFVYEWGQFERAWGDFWAEHASSWRERFWTGVYDRVVEFRKRAGDWRQRFEALGGVPSTPKPRPPSEGFLDGIDIPWGTIFLVGGGILAGTLIVPVLIRAARQESPP